MSNVLATSVFQYRYCKLFSERDFHDWRWLGWPLGSIIPVSVTEKWCHECGLRKRATKAGFVDADYVIPNEAGYTRPVFPCCGHSDPPNVDGSCSAYGYNGVDCQAQPCVCRVHIVSNSEAVVKDERNQWYGRDFCPHPDKPCIDGCSFCGARLEINEHNHTLQQRKPDRYECVCFNC